MVHPVAGLKDLRAVISVLITLIEIRTAHVSVMMIIKVTIQNSPIATAQFILALAILHAHSVSVQSLIVVSLVKSMLLSGMIVPASVTKTGAVQIVVNTTERAVGHVMHVWDHQILIVSHVFLMQQSCQ